MFKSSDQQDKNNNITLEEVSVDDFYHVGISSLLEEYLGLCDSRMWLELSKLASDAYKSGNIAGQRAYNLLATLCTFRMSSDDPADTWRPRWQDSEQTMLTPSALHKNQNLILATIIFDIGHSALRARIADVVWSNDRSQYKAGAEAVKAYCEIIKTRIVNMENNEAPNYSFIFELVNLLQRALYINTSISKRNLTPNYLIDIFENFYELAFKKCLYVVFQRIGELATGYKLKTWQQVAQDGELLVNTGSKSDYPEARKKVWALSAKCHEKAKNMEGRRRCLEQLTYETLRMCEQVSSYAAKASWTRQAIIELQVAGQFREWIEKLSIELRSLQQASLSEMSTISVPFDLSKVFYETKKKFEEFNLPEILYHFALISVSPAVKDLQKTALEHRPSGLASLFPNTLHIDREGKVITKTSSSFNGDSPCDEWFKANSLTTMNLIRHTVVEAGIKPARFTVMLNFPLELRHFDAIVNSSPFIPYGHEHIFSLGFSRFWQGDFVSASYILIPQLENTLRHVLACNGRDTSKFIEGENQEDRSLSGILDNRRDDLVAVLGENIVNEIDLLFHYKAGPSLRHKVAHGKLTAGDCYSTDSVYACWFIYSLICLPILDYWEEQIAPQIELTL
ncbi:hypothetical protein SC206_01900 [Rouxiella sp. T17]|uniref:DUF7380 domain-containing protein n=1 Tax=Rouxiella sp. T17 TaxID=3085684 RepID=UPI002FC94C13